MPTDPSWHLLIAERDKLKSIAAFKVLPSGEQAPKNRVAASPQSPGPKRAETPECGTNARRKRSDESVWAKRKKAKA